MTNKPPLIIITGPTAVGKTAVSVELASRINGEIISADSMQVYKGMDIGTAKIREEEKKGIPHHLIDIIEPDEEFNVTIFKKLAEEHINDIISRGRIPIIAGALVYSRLPETMATHWNMSGEPDGWSSRAFAVFGLPGILLAVNLLTPFMLRADPKHENMSTALKKVAIWSIPLLKIEKSSRCGPIEVEPRRISGSRYSRRDRKSVV